MARFGEWETFWKTFEHTVHFRNIDDLYKLNYLLDALEGDARESVKQFEISGHTYPLVIAYLKEKYGDKEALIERLYCNLQATQARSNRLEDQESLCEKLDSIISQLRIKNEHVDNVFLQKLLLGKFSPDVQRYILRQKSKQKPDGTWDTQSLLLAAKEYIKDEIRISHQMKQWTTRDTTRTMSNIPHETTARQFRQNSCFYCGKSGHKPRDCNEATTLEKRLEIMKQQKLCHNCGGRDHKASVCTRGACSICRETGNHTSICGKLSLPNNQTVTRQKQTSSDTYRKPQPVKRPSSTMYTAPNLIDPLKPAPHRAQHTNDKEDKLETQILAEQALYPLTQTHEDVSGRRAAKQRGVEKTSVQSTHRANVYKDSQAQSSLEKAWEQFFEFERTDTRQFTGLSSEERRSTNAAIRKTFEENSEKREDGDYVRVPRKTNVSQLPDNKQLSDRSLKGNVIHLTENEAVLQQCYDTIMDHLEKGTVEEVSEERSLEGLAVHYSPHHTVITLQEEPTKPRIVLDPSTHLQNFPFAQGPVILPEICDDLYCSIIGETATISNVKKAFRPHPSRQFRSNNSPAKNQIAPTNLCRSEEVEVFGITWNKRNDDTIPVLQKIIYKRYLTAVERKLALQVIIRNHQRKHLQDALETTINGNDHGETTSLKSHRKRDEHYNPRPRQNTHCKQIQQSEDTEDIEITEPPKKGPSRTTINNIQQNHHEEPDDNLQEGPPRSIENPQQGESSMNLTAPTDVILRRL